MVNIVRSVLICCADVMSMYVYFLFSPGEFLGSKLASDGGWPVLYTLSPRGGGGGCKKVFLFSSIATGSFSSTLLQQPLLLEEVLFDMHT